MAAVLDQRLGRVRCALEAVYHRHNCSAILRTADALGIHTTHLVEGHFRPGRGAARGAERWLDLRWEPGVESALEALRTDGFDVWVADFDVAGVAPEEVPLERPVCLWFGAELAGVSPTARAAATGVITLPMRGFAQSLNVSVAAALALRPVAERMRAAHGAGALLAPAVRAATLAEWRRRERAIDADAAGSA
jgi:tRNA (guanosine-2'-O-)-methyltransferase